MNKMLLLNLMISYVRQQCINSKELPLGKILAYVQSVDIQIRKEEIEREIQELVHSKFIPEIRDYDAEREVLFLNC